MKLNISLLRLEQEDFKLYIKRRIAPHFSAEYQPFYAENSQKTSYFSHWMSTEKQRFFWDAGKVVAFPRE